jgi:predicted ATP-grasp superfamily ATP-dependent carboligase
MPEALLILGASARAAAQSACRAGFAVACGDLFADVDVRQCAEAAAVAEFPAGLEAVARAAPPGGWMYTGGLENHPTLVERIAATRPLWGNSAAVLRRVRDPSQVAKALQRAGLDVPECRETAPDALACAAGEPCHAIDTSYQWLHKGKHSSGGSQVRLWHGHRCEAADGGRQRAARNTAWYFQQRIEGRSCSAVYVAAGGKATLVGATEQLLARDGPAEGAFRYAGSVGPLPLAATCRQIFERIGQALAREFALVGLFGVDAIVAGDRVWPVEVNPRYPASVEVLEWALACGAAKGTLGMNFHQGKIGMNSDLRNSGMDSDLHAAAAAVGWHVAACRERKLPALPNLGGGRWFGKQVHFARRDMMISEATNAKARTLNAGHSWPSSRS